LGDVKTSEAKQMTLKNPVVLETTFANYIATDVIGEGGAGRIYKATDESGAMWAIKLLDASKASKERAKRFKNEILFCLKNQHPNIVAVVDHGIFRDKDKSVPFYVMQLYGGSLRKLLQSGTSPKIPKSREWLCFVDC
jgi:serine/threonine protein kinase